MDAVADLGFWIGDVFRVKPLVYREPGDAAIVGAESAGGGNGDEDTLVI